MVKAGRYRNAEDGAIHVVIGIAYHTSGEYRLVIHHLDKTPENLLATPVAAFTEKNGHGVPLFGALITPDQE